MRLHLLTYLGCAAVTLGCAGGQSGDLSGDNDGGGETSSGGNCDEHKQPVDFDEMTDLGTAEQVLRFAEKSFDAPLTWPAERAGQPWHAGPESGASSLHLEVTRGEKAYLLSYTPKESDSGIEIGFLCPEPSLGIDVHVEVSSEGGALAESFDTRLLGVSPQLATLSVPLALDKLAGELSVTYDNPQTKLVQVGLSATLMAEGMTGSISGIEQTDNGAVTSAGQALLAVWPNSPACAGQYGDNSGIALAPDQNGLGITAEAAAALIGETTPADVTWRDGTQTKLTVAVAVQGDGCLKVSNNYGLDEGQNGQVTYPARFTLSSEDGRVDGEYAGTLVTWPTAGANGVNAEAHLDFTLEQLAESGFPEVDIPSDVERLVVSFQVSIEDGITMGTVLLNGLSDPPCLTMPAEPMPTPGGGMSSPGCEGSHVTPLESASWGD